MSNNVWGPMNAPMDECLQRDIGGVTLWTRVVEDEWQIAHSYKGTGEDSDLASGRTDAPDLADLSWTRYVTVRDDDVVTQPALPDRPVVIRPQSPIVILPGRWGRFYFSVPLWVRFVSHSGGRAAMMVEIPTQNLSSTWFGDMESGDLCYSVDSRLLRTIPDTDADDAYARCEVEIRNGSRERLQFERLCVHVEHMHLYTAGGKFWSNQVRVVFKGAEQVSQLSYVPGAPKAVGDGEAVCEPRLVLDTNIFKRSFNLIREITGI
jgi:hypothetical protein